MFNSQTAKRKMLMTKTRRRTRLLFWKSIWIKTGMRRALFEPSSTTARKMKKIKTTISKIRTNLSLIRLIKRTTLKVKIKTSLSKIRKMMKTLTNYKRSS